MKTENNKFTFYTATNYYGVKMYAIGHTDAMPVNYDEILFTGTIKECEELMNATKQHYEVGAILTVKEYKTAVYIITADTPFTYEKVKITKAIAPKHPLNKYSEYRYNYESVKRLSELRDVPAFTGNIGQELLSKNILVNTVNATA